MPWITNQVAITGLSKEEAIHKLAQNGPRLYGSEENHKTLDAFMALLNR